jgi:hypothetical protein
MSLPAHEIINLKRADRRKLAKGLPRGITVSAVRWDDGILSVIAHRIDTGLTDDLLEFHYFGFIEQARLLVGPIGGHG